MYNVIKILPFGDIRRNLITGGHTMGRTLVAFFSASGVTAGVAKKLAASVGADLFEIIPEQPYTKADLNWLNKNSRSTLEMKDRNCRPAIASSLSGFERYDVVFVGF